MSRKRNRKKPGATNAATSAPPTAPDSAATGKAADDPPASAPPRPPTPQPRPGPIRRLRDRFSGYGEALLLIALVVGPLLGIFLLSRLPQAISLLHQETVVDTVVRSERVSDGESAKYLVFGEREVYQNTDNLILRKFNSSDFYRDIMPNKTYRFTVIGWRIPIFSLYRNIVGFEEVKE